jgi:hypothetical protein
MSRLLGTHVGAAFIALLTAGGLLSAGSLASLLAPPAPAGGTAPLTLAYTQPLTLTVAVGRRGGGGIVDVAQDGGTETAHVTLPAEWERTEVSGVPLEEAGSTPLSLHWTSWELPPGSRLRFMAKALAAHADLALPSGVPISLTVVRADLDAGTSDQETKLLQGSSVALW